MTGKDMCEFINDELFDGKKDPIKDIWECSRTGELWPVYAAFEDAKNVALKSRGYPTEREGTPETVEQDGG